jgi:hypothetical protein
MQDVTAPLVIERASHYADGPLVIENLTLWATAPGQTAITVIFPESPSIAQSSVFIRNVCIRPGNGCGWANGIRLVNCWNPDISAVSIYGGQTDDPAQGGGLQNGIILDGETMDARIRSVSIVHPITGILVVGQCEGPNIAQTTVLGGIYGVMANTALDESGIWVSDSHFNVSRAGVVLMNRPEAFLHDLLIYQHPWRAGAAFDAVVSNKVDTKQRDIVVRRPYAA